jgi:hypothetical protein
MQSYEDLFADLPDEISASDAMIILGVESTQGVIWIVEHLPEDAPPVTVKFMTFGQRRYRMYNKAEIIALRRYRDKREG